ncbi:MAG: SLOG family protein [Paraclostridium sp.]
MKLSSTVCFTGHRSINGSYDIFDDNWSKVRNKLEYIIEECIKLGVTDFISGCALGVDTLAFIMVHNLKEKYPHIKNHLAIPFDGFNNRWNESSKELFNAMLSGCDSRVNCRDLEKYSNTNNYKVQLMLRNMYMVDNSGIVIAVYNGERGGTQNCYNYAKSKDRVIIRINPKEL